MRLVLSSIAIAVVLGVAPAAYAQSCAAGSSGGFDRDFDPHAEQHQDEFDLMQLRAQGVDAVQVDRWSGCIRAFVRNDDGSGTHMEYFLPDTYRRAS
jgi:hypothetical protein